MKNLEDYAERANRAFFFGIRTGVFVFAGDYAIISINCYSEERRCPYQQFTTR